MVIWSPEWQKSAFLPYFYNSVEWPKKMAFLININFGIRKALVVGFLQDSYGVWSPGEIWQHSPSLEFSVRESADELEPSLESSCSGEPTCWTLHRIVEGADRRILLRDLVWPVGYLSQDDPCRSSTATSRSGDGSGTHHWSSVFIGYKKVDQMMKPWFRSFCMVSSEIFQTSYHIVLLFNHTKRYLL